MTTPSRREAPDRNLALELVRVTEAGAMAAGRWVGRGDKEGGDGAAVDAMRELVNSVSMRGVVVIGEGEKDNACGWAERWGDLEDTIQARRVEELKLVESTSVTQDDVPDISWDD